MIVFEARLIIQTLLFQLWYHTTLSSRQKTAGVPVTHVLSVAWVLGMVSHKSVRRLARIYNSSPRLFLFEKRCVRTLNDSLTILYCLQLLSTHEYRLLIALTPRIFNHRKEMAENELGTWFRSIPIVTRWWFSLSIIFPLLGRIGLINGIYMILDYTSIIYRFQVRNNSYKKQLQLCKLVDGGIEKCSKKLSMHSCCKLIV